MIDVTLIPILSDNYAYLISTDRDAYIIDPGEPGPIKHVLDEKKLHLHSILNTHHHPDHIGGNAVLRDHYGANIIGPEKERSAIHDMAVGLKEGDPLTIGNEAVDIIETPGHTHGHICFYFKQSQILFAGDTLFSMGCGRLFEGTADALFHSLQKIKTLPDQTKIYCGHEYTLKNAEFCLSIDPDNKDLQARYEEVKKLSANNIPTLPTTLEQEKKTNIFLQAETVEAFAALREKRDNF